MMRLNQKRTRRYAYFQENVSAQIAQKTRLRLPNFKAEITINKLKSINHNVFRYKAFTRSKCRPFHMA
jgi:hypothetical protein